MGLHNLSDGGPRVKSLGRHFSWVVTLRTLIRTRRMMTGNVLLIVYKIQITTEIIKSANRDAPNLNCLPRRAASVVNLHRTMTDLFETIPDFPIKQYTHLLPSLEKHLVTTSDLLILDASEIAKRAQLPLLDVRRLTDHVVSILQRQLGLGVIPDADDQPQAGECLRKYGREITSQWSTISTVDDSLDRALGGGIPTGYLTEIVGERYFTMYNSSCS